MSPVTWRLTPAFAQGTIGSLTCLKRDRAVILRWVETPALSDDSVRCKYDYDTVSLDRQSKEFSANSANSGRRQCVIYDLAPDDDVFLGPQVSDSTETLWSSLLTCSGACTNCDSGDDSFFGDDGSGGSGCDCGGAGEFPKVHTDVEDTDPAPDPPVTGAQLTRPTPTAAAITVDGTCSDLAARLADAITEAGDGDVVELVLPAGVYCPINSFNLTSIANDGWVIVTSSADAKLLPPAGSMIDATYLPHMARIGPASMGHWGQGDEVITSSTNGRGWYFENTAVGPPPLDSAILAPLNMAITAINTTTNTITVDDITGLSLGDSNETVVVDLTGTGVFRGHGIVQLCDVTSTTPPAGTFTLATGGVNKGFCGNQVDLTGTYSSGGTITRFIALPIEGHGTSAGGNHTVTITGHGLANFPAMTITSAPASNQLTVSGTIADYQLSGSNIAALVAGTSEEDCDGLWNVTSSGSTFTLSRSGQTPDCTGVTSGTIRRQKAISIFRTSNDTLGDYEPQAFNWNAVDDDTIELLETQAIAGVTGGYLFWDVELFGSMFSAGTATFSESREDITFDRVLIQACLPWHSSGAGAVGNSENLAFINSWVESCAWRRQNPVSGSLEYVHNLFVSHIVFLPTDAQGFTVRNSYFWPSPFIFADNSQAGSSIPEISVNDLTIRGNYLWNPDWTIKTSGAYRNHWFERSFPIELKSAGSRIDLSANYFKGWKSNFQATAPAIGLAINGSENALPSGANHVRMDSNIFDRGASILQVAADTGGERTADRRWNFTEKLSLSNNLAIRIDTPKYQPNDNSGLFVTVGSGYRDFVIERNTYIPERAMTGKILGLNQHRSSGMRVVDNIFGFTEGSNTNEMGVTQTLATGQIPAETEDGGNAAFEEFHIRGTVTDPLSFWSGNIGVPMLKVSSSGTYSVKAASADPADTHCQSSISVMDKVLDLPVTWVGNTNSPCNQSLNERLNLTFQGGTWRPSGTYSGKGADLDALADAQGLPGPVSVTADHDSISLTFHAPTIAACAVDVAPWTGNWATTWDNETNIARSADPSPDQEQAVTFGGLNPITTYAYRGHCKREFIGLVRTAGAP